MLDWVLKLYLPKAVERKKSSSYITKEFVITDY